MGVSLKPSLRVKDRAPIITISLVLMLVNTCEEALRWCLRTIGTGHIVRQNKGKKRRRTCYRYVLGNNWALLQLLPVLRPYLKIRTAQVDAALAFLRNRASRPVRSAFTEIEVDHIFAVRLANQFPYDKQTVACVRYKKKMYTKEEFRTLLLSSRNSSNYRVVDWTSEMDAVVGTDIDSRVASKLGLKLGQVQRRRALLGKPHNRKMAALKATRILRLRAAGHTMTEIAETVGLSFSSVQRILTCPPKT